MKTQELLELTDIQYEMLLFGNYCKWCESVSMDLNQYQQALSNAAISKWYMLEYAKCEEEFRLLARSYNNLTMPDFGKLYAKCVYHMFNIRPKALLDDFIKKPNQGIKIFSNVINN
jgi:hypothetical protein